MTYVLLFLLLLTGGVLTLARNPAIRRNLYAVYLGFTVPLLLVLGGLRAAGVDADYFLYQDWFSSMADGTLTNPFLKDPSFALIGYSLQDLGLGFVSLILIYCALCLLGQLLFAFAALDRRWVPLGVFLILCRFFIPHEMTQIRASVAIPLMSLAVLAFFRRRFRRGTLLLVLAASFHLSALIAVPVCALLAAGITFRSRRWVVALAALAVLGYFAFARVSVVLTLFARTSDYVTGSYTTTTSSLLSLYLLCRIALIGLACLLFWKRFGEWERLLIVCSSLGVMLEIALSSNDALAIRSGELFGLFDVASALAILSLLQRRAAVVYLLFLLCLGGVFYSSTTKIVQPYASQFLH